jgi:hypothetical protein
MRRTIPIAIVLSALGCAACGSSSSAGSAGLTSTAPSSSQTTTTNYTGPTIPDGTYRYVDRPADVIRVGYPTSEVPTLLGADRREPIIFKVSGLQFSVFDDEGSGTGLGDLGTLRYVGDHLVYMTSHSTGCPGCLQLWHWSAPGGSVTLVERKAIRDDTQDDPRDERLVLEHTFGKVG